MKPHVYTHTHIYIYIYDTTEALDVLEDLIDATNYERVVRYLLGCVPHVAAPENVNILNTCVNIYLKQKRHPDALRLALQLHDMKVVKRVFSDCEEPIVQKQLALILSSVLAYIDLEVILLLLLELSSRPSCIVYTCTCLCI